MAAKWNDMPAHWPVDGATVWCRRYEYSSAPFKATWSQAAWTFTALLGGSAVPWWAISQWRVL